MTSSFGLRASLAALVIAVISFCIQCSDDKSNNPSTPSIELTEVGVLDGLQARDVAVSGNAAYVADEAQVLVIVNVENRTSPSIVGSIGEGGGENGVAVAVSGNYAYVAVESNGLYIIDVSQPATPTKVGQYSEAYAKDVAVSGTYAYVADQDYGLRVIDISSPQSPELVGSCRTREPFAVAISGSYAYCADSDSGVCIIDISNPASPTIVGRYLGNDEVRTIDVQGEEVYFDDDETGPYVLDVSDPADPTLVGHYEGDCLYLKADGDFVLVSYLTQALAGGLAAIDVSDLAQPALGDSATVSTTPAGIDVDGDYVYLAAYEQFLIYSKD